MPIPKTNALKPFPFKPAMAHIPLGGAVPGIGTQTATDDFNRANEDPITTNWTNQAPGGNTPIALVSNAYTAHSLASDAHAYRTGWAGGNDQYSQAAITAGSASAGAGAGVAVRVDTAAATKTMYRLVLDNGGNYELLKIVVGVTTSLRTGTVTYVAGQKLGLSATGGATTTLKIWYNGSQVGASVTDSSSPITTGSPGIAYSSTLTSASGDNWDGGTVP